MKRIFFILAGFCVFAFTAKTQNLVPNPSFEIYSTCPTNIGQLTNATPWYSPSTQGTPDYFHVCGSNGATVPVNSFGNETARTGQGYAGFYTFNYFFPNNGREYIQVKLNDTLILGKKYFVRFYVSLADNMKYAISSIGAYFSPTPISSTNGYVLPYSPQIINPAGAPIIGKTGWSLVQDTLYASGGELYLCIGNFKSDSASDTTNLGSGTAASYYYIDDISVIDNGWVGVNEPGNNSTVIKCYPNPSYGKIDFEFENNNQVGKNAEIIFYDVLGNELRKIKSSIRHDMELSLHDFTNGIYFYKIFVDDTLIQSDKVILIK